MSSTDVQQSEYKVPEGILGLKGPVHKPEPGTLPLRGDLAHIVLADRHLAAHYVIPHIRHIGANGADVMENTREDSAIVTHFEAGTKVEILDLAGDWVWACLGPDGPSGYFKAHCLAD